MITLQNIVIWITIAVLLIGDGMLVWGYLGLRKLVDASHTNVRTTQTNVDTTRRDVETVALYAQAAQNYADAVTRLHREITAQRPNGLDNGRFLSADDTVKHRPNKDLPCLPCNDIAHGFPDTHCDNHGVAITERAGCPHDPRPREGNLAANDGQ